MHCSSIDRMSDDTVHFNLSRYWHFQPVEILSFMIETFTVILQYSKTNITVKVSTMKLTKSFEASLRKISVKTISVARC